MVVDPSGSELSSERKRDSTPSSRHVPWHDLSPVHGSHMLSSDYQRPVTLSGTSSLQLSHLSTCYPDHLITTPTTTQKLSLIYSGIYLFLVGFSVDHLPTSWRISFSGWIPVSTVTEFHCGLLGGGIHSPAKKKRKVFFLKQYTPFRPWAWFLKNKKKWIASSRVGRCWIY